MTLKQHQPDVLRQSLEEYLVGFDEPCAYLSDRVARLEGFFADEVPAAFYRGLMDLGFRRSGRFFYHTKCRGCSECRPIRVPVEDFAASRSQRRCLRRNCDLVQRIGRPECNEEKLELFGRYVRVRHGQRDTGDLEAVREFLYSPVVDSLEFSYRDPEGKLVAVGICDLFSDAISSVYAFYDPAEKRRGLGTYTALKEIEFARQRSLAYYYLGFWVNGCGAMSYKAEFRPHELIDSAGIWCKGAPLASVSGEADMRMLD